MSENTVSKGSFFICPGGCVFFFKFISYSYNLNQYTDYLLAGEQYIIIPYIVHSSSGFRLLTCFNSHSYTSNIHSQRLLFMQHVTSRPHKPMTSSVCVRPERHIHASVARNKLQRPTSETGLKVTYRRMLKTNNCTHLIFLRMLVLRE